MNWNRIKIYFANKLTESCAEPASFVRHSLILILIAYSFSCSIIFAGTKGYVTFARPVTESDKINECRKTFGGDANSNFWVTQHIEFSYGPNFHVIHKGFGKEKTLNESDINNIDYNFFTPTNAISYEYVPENKSPTRGHSIRKKLIENWIQATKQHRRFRKNLDTQKLISTEESLNLNQTSLFYFENGAENMGFRIYDSSKSRKFHFELWPIKNKENKGNLEQKYLDKIPEFSQLVSKHNNILSLGLFSSTKGWKNAKDFLYHQVSRYIDTHYNNSAHFLLGSVNTLKENDVLVLAAAPKGMSKIIHKGVEFELLKDRSGKTIYTPDGYEIMYLRGSEIVSRFNDGPAIPILKSETKAVYYNKAWEYFRKRSRKEFLNSLNQIKFNLGFFLHIGGQLKELEQKIKELATQANQSTSEEMLKSKIHEILLAKAEYYSLKVSLLRVQSKERVLSIEEIQKKYPKEFYEYYAYYYLAAASKNPIAKILVLDHVDRFKAQIRNNSYMSLEDFPMEYFKFTQEKTAFEFKERTSYLENAEPAKAVKGIQLLLAGILAKAITFRNPEETQKSTQYLLRLLEARLHDLYSEFN